MVNIKQNNMKDLLKKEYLQSMKDKNVVKKNLFGVIIGEIQNQELRGVESNDENVMSVLKKMEKSLLQTNTKESLEELEYIKPFLPEMLSEKQISELVEFCVETLEFNNIGQIMGYFNKEYNSNFFNFVNSIHNSLSFIVHKPKQFNDNDSKFSNFFNFDIVTILSKSSFEIPRR